MIKIRNIDKEYLALSDIVGKWCRLDIPEIPMHTEYELYWFALGEPPHDISNVIQLNGNEHPVFINNGLDFVQKMTGLYLNDLSAHDDLFFRSVALSRLPAEIKSINCATSLAASNQDNYHGFLWINVLYKTDKLTLIFSVGVFYDVVMSLWQKYATPVRKEARSAHLSKIPLSLKCFIGEVDVSVEELNDVCVGDFVFMNKVYFDPRADRCYLKIHQWVVSLNKKSASKYFIDGWDVGDKRSVKMAWGATEDRQEEVDEFDDATSQVEESIASDEGEFEVEDTSGAMADFSKINMRVMASIGELRMQLKDLEHMSAGAIISLNKSMPPVVDLIVNDTKIGSGELVEVDGILAIQITKIEMSREER